MRTTQRNLISSAFANINSVGISGVSPSLSRSSMVDADTGRALAPMLRRYSVCRSFETEEEMFWSPSPDRPRGMNASRSRALRRDDYAIGDETRDTRCSRTARR